MIFAPLLLLLILLSGLAPPAAAQTSATDFITMGTFGELEHWEDAYEEQLFAVHRYRTPCNHQVLGFNPSEHIPVQIPNAWGFRLCFSGTATPAGSNRAWFSIDHIDDTHPDSGETIIATLSQPHNTNLFTYGKSSITFIILNDEVLPYDE